MSAFSDITVTMEGLLGALYALVAVMVIVVLYHLLFIVADLRRIMRRFEETTAQVEAMLLKPLSIIDEAFQWVVDHIHGKKKGYGGKKKKHESVDVEVTNV